MALELLLERCQRAITLLGQLLDRDIAKYVSVDYLFEIITRRVNIIQYFALQAAIRKRDDEVDEFCHLYILCRLVVHKIVIV